METKAIIFDMGGVLVDLNLGRCIEEFKKIGFDDVGQYLNRYHQLGLFGMLEGGELDEEGFYRELAPHCRPGTTDEEMKYAFVSALDGMDPRKPDLLGRLSKKYKLYVLSNNNPLTVGDFHRMLAEAGHPMEELFEDTFYSFQLKLQKPSPEIFQYVLEHIDFEPEEMLFVDDSITNLEAAQKFGIRTALMVQGSDLEELINANIL